MLSLFGSVVNFLAKLGPMIGAYFAGKKAQRLDQAEKALERRNEIETIEDKVRRMPESDVDSGLSE